MKVLLVDDDHINRRVAQIALSRSTTWELTVASSGQQALQLIAEDCPDVVLLDVVMPAMDGLSTLARIRECAKLAKLPVIFMTAKVLDEEIAQYRSSEAAGVISKPFDPLAIAGDIVKIANAWTINGCHS